MPYIDPEIRAKLDPYTDELAKAIVGESRKNQTDFAGLLNYASTRVTLKVIQLRFGKIRYWILAIVTGVFINIVLELYRRVGSPYEDRQMIKNGDLDLFNELTKDVKSEPSK